MGQIFLAYGFQKEAVSSITMFYKDTKVMVHSPDSNTHYFDIVAEVLQGDTLVLVIFIIFKGYVQKMSKDLMRENGFTLKRYPAETITNADDLELLTNNPA